MIIRSTSNSNALIAAALAAVLGACATPVSIDPIDASADAGRLSEQENRLWHQARQLDERLASSGQLYPDESANAYVQETMDTLYPALRGTVRARVLASPLLNAFALPNGSVYISIGLLARLRNEAQLATVLGHEAAHFVHRHGLAGRRRAKSASVFAAGINVLGVPVVGDVIAVSSIYGFSRELERNADRVAFERLAAAGYDVRESVRVFEHLAAEAQALDERQPVFFSSHPSLAERIGSFESLIRASATAGGRSNAGKFLQRTHTVRLDALDLDRATGRHRSLLLVLESDHARTVFEPWLRHYYLGEAYRLRGQESDPARAQTAYREAIAASASYAPPYRALGFELLKSGNRAAARPLFERYLSLAPHAPDSAHVGELLNSIESGGAVQ